MQIDLYDWDWAGPNGGLGAQANNVSFLSVWFNASCTLI